jgi:tellurite methyltransferase
MGGGGSSLIGDGGSDGGYDAGYAACPCFWGTEPGSYVRYFTDLHPHLAGWRILDIGCGEGKNAAFLASLGAEVLAIDVSAAALSNARRHWGAIPRVTWTQGSVTSLPWGPETFDAVIAYGLLHCLSSLDEIRGAIARLKRTTRPGGFHVLCAFNTGIQELRAHQGFRPCLMAHDEYRNSYSDWRIVAESDAVLEEVHPHNGILHRHALTRLIAECPY